LDKLYLEWWGKLSDDWSLDPIPESTSGDKSAAKSRDDLIEQLALDLNIISPESPLLTDEDRKDLYLFDELTRAQIQINQILGVEAEIVEQETWNHDTSDQLYSLSQSTQSVPFGTSSKLFGQQQADLATKSGIMEPLPSSSRKGKEKEVQPASRMGMKKEVSEGRPSLFNILPGGTKDAQPSKEYSK